MIHPPGSHKSADLQKLHSEAFNDQDCQYQNFQLLPVGAQLSNPPGRVHSISCCTFLNDRIQIREEMTGISREDFEARIQRLAQLAMNHLNIPVYIVQQYVVRTLINPKQYTDSKEFVLKALLNMDSDTFLPLDRNADILGLRLALNKPDQNVGIFNVRIESYSQDPRSLFIENVGTYRTMIKTQNLHDITGNFTSTYSYIESHVVPFLSQFDDVS